MARKFEVGETVLITRNSKVEGEGKIVFIGKTLIEVLCDATKTSLDFCSRTLLMRSKDGTADNRFKICKMVKSHA